MIQRIQTVYLSAGALCMGSVILLENGFIGPDAVGAAWLAAVTLGIVGICTVGALIAVFLYADRSRQRSVVVLLQFLTVLALVSLFLGAYLGGRLPFVDSETGGRSRSLDLILVVAGYACFYLARRGIDRDIELLRSVDRLR